ncbi:MAG TPA: patatin-like phospholipase family protein [Longilinea sp.]|nr:patatin-like phospholipase family protein [Longilinea sp.]
MSKCTAIVLGGGGSRGALQIGALRALLEANIVPDLLVGTSIGAANATGLALWGVNLDGLSALERIWDQVADGDMLDPRIPKLIFRMMIGQPNDQTRKKVENYFVSLGISGEIKFHMTPYARLALISADMESGQTVIYGQNEGDLVLEGLLASISVPPWFMPFQKDGRMIIDGGLVSPLPIEPALQMGATEIFALDLNDPTLIPKENLTLPQYFQKVHFAAGRRHVQLETQIAKMNGVSVRCIDFQGLAKTTMWDFSDYRRLRQAGYEKAKMMIAQWS